MLTKQLWSVIPSDWQFINDTNTINQQNSDLDISDNDRNILVRFKNGHIKTKNFDSSKDASEEERGLMASTDKAKLNTIEEGAEVNNTITNAIENGDLGFSDEDGNILVLFKDGEIETKNFNSKYAPFIKEKSSITPFFIADINGNNIFIIKNNSHIKTKSFDSELLLTAFNSFQQYNRGGSSNQSITGIASDSDLKINSTLNHILEESPNSDVILVSNFYANSSVSRNSKRRAYREELKAFSDYYGLGYIDLSGLGIIRPTTVGVGIYTVDGVHAYTEAGAQKIYSYILGYLVSRYGDLITLESKKILILGDSSAIESPSSGTTWSAKLKSKLGTNNVMIKAVGGSGWLYNSQGDIDSQNVEWQFDQSLPTIYDIIIITSGGNELNRFNLDYQFTLNYLINQ